MKAAKLKTFLECPVCLMLPRNKIFACINSHKICESCFVKLEGDEGAKSCPQGGCIFDKPPRRARDAEAIIENSNFQMPCGKPGCNTRVSRGQLKVHEAQCIFRAVPCPHWLCDQEILFKNISSHIKDIHFTAMNLSQPIIRPFVDDNIFSNPNWNWCLFTYQEEGNEIYAQITKKRNLWYFWLTMKTDRVSAQSWKFCAKTENVQNHIAVEFTGEVQAVDSKLAEVFESGQHLILTNEQAKMLKTNNEEADEAGHSGTIDISFRIFRK